MCSLLPCRAEARPRRLTVSLLSLLVPGNAVIAETYPAECYPWFSEDRLRSKRDRGNRREFGASLLGWAESRDVMLANYLT